MRSSASSAASPTTLRSQASLDRRARWSAIAPVLYDRMTEARSSRSTMRRSCSRTMQPRRSARDCRCWRAAAPRWSRRTRVSGSRCPTTRSTTSHASFERLRPRSDRRRADDVRAGELRALPSQDLQRGLDHRRRAPAEVAVRDDQEHLRAQFARRAVGVSRQRSGDRRAARPSAGSRTSTATSTRSATSRSTF